MGNWERIESKEISKLDLNNESCNLTIEVDFKRLRKKNKQKSESGLNEMSIFENKIIKDKSINISLWLKNYKSDDELLSFLTDNSAEIETDLDFMIYALSDLELDMHDHIKCKTLLELDRRILPRDYEKTFNLLSNSTFRGVSIDVEAFKRSHIVLAHKFNLEFAITGIIHERHVEAVNASDADIKVYG